MCDSVWLSWGHLPSGTQLDALAGPRTSTMVLDSTGCHKSVVFPKPFCSKKTDS